LLPMATETFCKPWGWWCFGVGGKSPSTRADRRLRGPERKLETSEKGIQTGEVPRVVNGGEAMGIRLPVSVEGGKCIGEKRCKVYQRF